MEVYSTNENDNQAEERNIKGEWNDRIEILYVKSFRAMSGGYFYFTDIAREDQHFIFNSWEHDFFLLLLLFINIWYGLRQKGMCNWQITQSYVTH